MNEDKKRMILDWGFKLYLDTVAENVAVEKPLPKGVFVTELPNGSLKVRQVYDICNPGV